MKLADLSRLPATIGVDLAAEILGIGRAHAYSLIRSNQFPARVLHLGRRLRVVTASLVQALGVEDDQPDEFTGNGHQRDGEG
jgi:predicted DNA-binding transcriptional regulator AlpA